MMDKRQYEVARDWSGGLFNNALVLPVAAAVLETAEEGATFVMSELREELGGRVAAESIRKALDRIVSVEAAVLLRAAGPPHPDVWERRPHVFWTFIADWIAQLGGEVREPEDSSG
jgi:hypothetical protein